MQEHHEAFTDFGTQNAYVEYLQQGELLFELLVWKKTISHIISEMGL